MVVTWVNIYRFRRAIHFVDPNADLWRSVAELNAAKQKAVDNVTPTSLLDGTKYIVFIVLYALNIHMYFI